MSNLLQLVLRAAARLGRIFLGRRQPCPCEPEKRNSRVCQSTFPSAARLPFGSLGLVGLLAATKVEAATNVADEIGIPKLLPPYSELPPTFWERHGLSMLLLGFAIWLVAGALFWLLRRSKPVVVLPPDVQARRALESLSSMPENGDTLSRVARIVREYFRATFDLSRDELTTTEFCRVLSNHERAGVELATKVSIFLRHCDRRRFSPAVTEPSNAVASALELVAIGETKRTQLLPAGNPAQTARPVNA